MRFAVCLATALIAATQVTGQTPTEAERLGAISASDWVLSHVGSSATFALLKGELLSSTGLSWPDGRQAVVTFWYMDSYGFLGGEFFRCIDYFDKDMISTGGACKTARGRN